MNRVAAIFGALAVIFVVTTAKAADPVKPCQILRENLYRHYADRPAWIFDQVAYCVANYQHRKIRVLTDPDEIADFRAREFIARPEIVQKPTGEDQ